MSKGQGYFLGILLPLSHAPLSPDVPSWDPRGLGSPISRDMRLWTDRQKQRAHVLPEGVS